MTKRRLPPGESGERGRGAGVAVTVAFALLGLALAGLMALYRTRVLEPRLRAEAVLQGQILARSQAAILAQALRSTTGPALPRAVERAMDELLLLRDPETGTPFFRAIGLEVDPDAFGAAASDLDMVRGATPGGQGGFRVDVPLYDSNGFELQAIAWFDVSDRFFRQLSADVRDELRGVTVAVLVLLTMMWGALLVLLRILDRQRLRAAPRGARPVAPRAPLPPAARQPQHLFHLRQGPERTAHLGRRLGP